MQMHVACMARKRINAMITMGKSGGGDGLSTIQSSLRTGESIETYWNYNNNASGSRFDFAIDKMSFCMYSTIIRILSNFNHVCYGFDDSAQTFDSTESPWRQCTLHIVI